MSTSHQELSVASLLRVLDLATDLLAQAREEIDALNVYPVPDGDTGTNMYLTVSEARDAAHASARRSGHPDEPVGDALHCVLRDTGRAALLGARGNSGVILSQIIGAFAARFSAGGSGEPVAVTFAAAMTTATEASYAAVGTPVEGTILTVMRAAAEAARARAEQDAAAGEPSLRKVVSAAAEAARLALARTPEQLSTLADAGVVDAGGRGLCVLLDAVEETATGRRSTGRTARLGGPRIPTPMPTGDLTEDGPAYEVMYLLEADEDRIGPLRKSLGGLGDSLVVVGSEQLWHVHVHVDDVGAAVEAGIEAGRPYRVRVTHFAEQVRDAQSAHASTQSVRRTGRRVVTVAAGPGLAEIFAEAGAEVVRGGPGNRPSTGQILAAIEECGAAEVVLLPNDPDSVRAAEFAARTAEEGGEVRVAVIPTRAQVHGLAALAVHEPGRTFEQDIMEMTATARHARDGAVTLAARRAITMAGPCEAGDVLGVIAGDFAVVGQDLDAVAREVVERLLAGGGELVTIVSGANENDVDAVGLAARLAEYVETEHAAVDVMVYDGGQVRYPLLVAVE